MRQISRHEAESLFDESNVIATKVEHDKEGLRVSLQLKDDRSCVICYNSENGRKLYYIDSVVI